MKKVYFLLLMLFPLFVYGQDLNLKVMGASGEYFQNATGSISWTIGEPIIETLTNGTNTLTQGFHQRNLSIATLIKEPGALYNINVYPNPVQNMLNIETDKTGVYYQLLNMNGEVISNGTLEGTTQVINFSDIKPGIYILRINNQKTHKIIKQ